ncbi:hypothetical protein ACFFQF_12995 [Haladaptatus pallidirubidus]|uniref:hypothetical protein n=1 Tax=Haladaptatus pallidirubidus TaxID=1008152 RepID=UPI001D12E54D|nr:hypothetical protein [Haladaptatus pallidirubidus]
MTRDDVVTFALALVAAVITFLLIGRGAVDDSLMFVVAFVIFGIFIFFKSYLCTSN